MDKYVVVNACIGLSVMFEAANKKGHNLGCMELDYFVPVLSNIRIYHNIAR